MRGAATHGQLGPDEPLVGDHDLAVRGLGDDRRVGLHGAEHLLHAEAGVLLIGHGGDDHVAAEAEIQRLTASEQTGGKPGLHVIGAASVQLIAVHAGHERIGHPLHADGVEMSAQQQRSSAATPFGAHHDARPRPVEALHAQPLRRGPGGHERRDLGLPRPAGNQRRVHGVDGNQSRQEFNYVH